MCAWGGERKRRTRGHVIADLSLNFLERRVLERGHCLQRLESDYGVDAIMFHFSKSGEVENGEARFQLKATDNLKVLADGETIAFRLDRADLHHWCQELYPFFLIVYDAPSDKAYWLHIQPYVEEYQSVLDPDKEKVTVHIPSKNLLTLGVIDMFRSLSLRVVEERRKKGGLPHVPK